MPRYSAETIATVSGRDVRIPDIPVNVEGSGSNYLVDDTPQLTDMDYLAFLQDGSCYHFWVIAGMNYDTRPDPFDMTPTAPLLIPA